jgi:hypothetical protein
MTKIIKGVCGVLTAMLLLASCMKSKDNSASLYKDTAITSFSLGTMKRSVHTTSSTGADSVYKVNVAGSDYKFSIDQLNHRIFNVDSLPIGTEVSKVLCSVTALNNGSVFVEDLKEEGTLLFYSDSLDFSVPRTFRVYASDGKSYESYRVEVNVHKEEAETFTWMIHEEAPALATFTGMKAFTVQGELYVFGSTSDGKTMVYSSVDGDNWEKHSEFNDAESYANTVVSQEEFYTIVGGKLFKSSDATEWEEVNGTLDINQLVASSYSDLYGLTADGYLLVSDDYGVSWTEDKLDSDVSWLPITGISAVCYPANMTYYADYVVMAGISSGVDKIASVWRKIVEYDLQGDEKWVYMSRSDNNSYALPLMENLVMMAYDDGILAWGVKDDAYTQIYQSRDNGIIWKKNSSYQLPAAFVESGTVPFGAATDGKEIWLVGSNGQVWQGHLNRVAWDKSE